MLMDFVTNASILLLCIFAYYFILLRFKGLRDTLSLRSRIATGAVFGLAGSLLTVASLQFEGLIRIDLRGMAVMLSALVGGLPTALSAGILVAIIRLMLGGVHFSPLVGVVTIFATALGCSWIRYNAPKSRVFIYSLLYSFIVNALSFAMVVKEVDILYKIWLYYALISLPTAWVCYQLILSLNRISELYDRLKFSEDKYRQLFHSAHDIVYLTAVMDGMPYRFLDVNETACKVLGYTKEQLLHMTPKDIYDPECLKELPHVIRMYKEKGQHTFEWRLRSCNGQIIPVEISGRIMQLQGEAVCVSVARDIAIRKEAEQKMLEANRMLEQLSVSDGLTGIANRRGFDEYYKRLWDDSLWQKEPLSVLLLDIDCFKLYNDTYGHLAGDQCLKEVAGVLGRMSLRPDVFAARYGGEEFVVVLPGADVAEALRRARSIRWSIEQLAVPHHASTVASTVTVSIGVAAVMEGLDRMEPQELLDAADRALYQAKRAGRNCVMLWEPTLNGEQGTG